MVLLRDSQNFKVDAAWQRSSHFRLLTELPVAVCGCHESNFSQHALLSVVRQKDDFGRVPTVWIQTWACLQGQFAAARDSD
jgi:hypothetical protein